MMMINNKTIQFKDISISLLEKTPFSEKGIKNVFRSMASEIIQSNKKDFLVYIKSNDKVFHITSNKSDDEITIELKNIYDSDLYVNSGPFTENITRKNIETLN